MPDLANLMHAAATDPPPTRIVLDRLIAAEELRVRRLRWASAAGSVAAAVAATVFAVTVLPGWAGGGESAGLVVPAVELCAPLTPTRSPTGRPQPERSYDTVRPRPTEPVAEAVSRLTTVLDETLLAQLPGVRVTPIGMPGCERPQFQFRPSYKEYLAGARLADGHGSGSFLLTLKPTAAENQLECQPVPDGHTCERRELKGGAVARAQTFPMEGGKQFQVVVDRSDGTTVLLMTNNLAYGDDPQVAPKVTRPQPVLTVDQLIGIGTTPGLTLYP